MHKDDDDQRKRKIREDRVLLVFVLLGLAAVILWLCYFS